MEVRLCKAQYFPRQRSAVGAESNTAIKKSDLSTALSDWAKPIPKIVARASEVFLSRETTLCVCKDSKYFAYHKIPTLYSVKKFITQLLLSHHPPHFSHQGGYLVVSQPDIEAD